MAPQPIPLVSGQRPPRIKVCGVTREEDLRLLASAGVDSVGLNLVPSSPRRVEVDQARSLCELARTLGLVRVAVVMNPSPAELSGLLSRLDLDFVQLHGAETPEIVAACPGVGIIKAISWTGREEEQLLASQWKQFSEDAGERSPLRAFLVDAYAPHQGGGTGKLARWDLLNPRPNALRGKGIRLLLAGGLTPQNVSEAIAATAAEGVDTASGGEISPGVKWEQRVSDFASRAAEALSRQRSDCR